MIPKNQMWPHGFPTAGRISPTAILTYCSDSVFIHCPCGQTERFYGTQAEPEKFAAYIRSEMEKWGKVMQTAGVKNDWIPKPAQTKRRRP